MTEHTDGLEEFNNCSPLKDKLVSAHNSLRASFPFIARIAVAIYDPATSMLKTYMHSSTEDSPLEHYQSLLDDSPSLKDILNNGKPRVINNMLTFENSKNKHTKRLGRQGYAASYTMPMFNNGVFFGFIFFNANETEVFNEQVLQQIDIYGHIISLSVINELSSIQTLSAAIKTSGSFTHARDPETGSHLDRMSRYSRLIATSLADKYNLSDSYIEHIFMFSPLHDIGKIAIPDNILLKPEKLTDKEISIMQTHARKGRDMIDELLENFNLGTIEYISVLRNIAEYHHEAINGSGYPKGIKGDEIPLEARIIAVADVFDALTSKRSYKEAWDNETAINTLKKMAGETLDHDCVNALISNIDQVEYIQDKFKENL